uniref:Peptidase A2 domain-containing protein n=1 Tax=Strongyloides venezuelensis TaxID=75913 RepID=A0A0K0FJ79_STRVS
MSKNIVPFLRRMTILLDSQSLDDTRKQAMKEFTNYDALVNSLKEKYNGQIAKTTAQSRLLSFQFEFKDVKKEILKFTELVKCAFSVIDEDELLNCQLDCLTIRLEEKNRTTKKRLMNRRKDYKSIQKAATDITCSINMHHCNVKSDHKKQRSEFNSCSYCKNKEHTYGDYRKRLNLCLKCGERGHKKKVENKSDFFIVKATISGYCFNKLIDSGSDSTIVPKSIAKEFVIVDGSLAVEIELPDLSTKSEFNCGNGIAVTSEQMMVNVEPLDIKYYSAPISKDIQANIDEMLKYDIISKSQVVEVSPFYPII